MAKEKNEYYNLLPVGIKKSKALTLNQKNVLAVLIYLDNAHPRIKEENDGWFYESLTNLIELTKLSKPTIITALSVLEHNGYISRKIGSFKEKNATQYKVNVLSVQNSLHNFTETLPIILPRNNGKISVKNDDDNLTKDKDKLNNNINNNINSNNFENTLQGYFQNINDLNCYIKDILEKMTFLEKENTDLKNEISSLKRNNMFLEEKVNILEEIVLPSQDEYIEENDDTNDDFSLTQDTSNMTYEERQRFYEESDKLLFK